MVSLVGFCHVLLFVANIIPFGGISVCLSVASFVFGWLVSLRCALAMWILVCEAFCCVSCKFNFSPDDDYTGDAIDEEGNLQNVANLGTGGAPDLRTPQGR